MHARADYTCVCHFLEGGRKPEETVHIVCATTRAHMQTLEWASLLRCEIEYQKKIYYIYIVSPSIVQMRSDYYQQQHFYQHFLIFFHLPLSLIYESVFDRKYWITIDFNAFKLITFVHFIGMEIWKKVSGYFWLKSYIKCQQGWDTVFSRYRWYFEVVKWK